MQVRRATQDDVITIGYLLQEWADTYHRFYPYDWGDGYDWVMEQMKSDRVYFGILGDNHGIFVGQIVELLFSKTLCAHELAWHVRPSSRGNGLRLLRDFEAWAKERNVFMTTCGLHEPHPILERRGYFPTHMSYFKVMEAED